MAGLLLTIVTGNVPATPDGTAVGDAVGAPVGEAVGDAVGPPDGEAEGADDGWLDAVGPAEGVGKIGVGVRSR